MQYFLLVGFGYACIFTLSFSLQLAVLDSKVKPTLYTTSFRRYRGHLSFYLNPTTRLLAHAANPLLERFLGVPFVYTSEPNPRGFTLPENLAARLNITLYESL